MAQRTTVPAVQALLGGSAITTNWDGVTSVQQFIDMATLFVDEVVSGRSSESVTTSTAQAEMFERIMAAHFYTKYDPVYTNRSTMGASGAFVRDSKTPEPYLAMAINMDTSGWINALINRLVASGDWLGKTVSEQIPYDERS